MRAAGDNAPPANRLLMAPPARDFRIKHDETEVTFGRARAMLGVSQQAVPALAKAGILQGSRTGATRPYLMRQSLEEFMSMYVNAIHYRKELRSGTTLIQQRLELLGVERPFRTSKGSRTAS